MNVRVLRYFLVVAREENITKAAQLLHVTQPTLSRQIMQLEEELGVKLFTRSNHNIILTDEGMLLRRRAQEIVSLAEKTVRDFSSHGEEVSGEISIGCGELHSMNCFSSLLSDFRAQYPRIHFDVYSGNADNIKERMERGLIDIALFAEPVDVMKYDFYRLDEKEEWGILVHKDAALAEKASVTPQDLVGVPLISAKRGLVQNELDHWFGDCANDIEIISTYNLIYNSAIMAKHKIGVLLCIRLDDHYDDLKFIPLSPKMETGSVIAWKKQQYYAPAAEAFIRFLKKYKN